MSYLSEISFRRAIVLLVAISTIIAAGTWVIVKAATNHLVDQYVLGTAQDWAKFVASNVNDLGEIAAGEQPSAASMEFFVATRKSDQVSRYVIFNRYGYSQLVVDRDKISPVDLSTYSPEAVRAIADRETVLRITRLPEFRNAFAEAFVPVVVRGDTVAVVAAYVDSTEAREVISATSWIAALALCLLTIMTFAVPAIAWYRRTREKQQADRRIHFLAHHDALTGLANRARLIERLESTLAVLPSTGASIAVHFIDVDRFKDVNDTFGHDGGDFLLSTIGQRLRAMARIEDMVARLGGDEFVVVQTAIADKEQVEDFATRITSVLGVPMYFKEQEISARCTIGVAIGPADGATPERLLKSADLALYAGKTAGRDCIRFFAPEMDEALQARVRLERIVRDAVLRDHIELHYQPVFEMSGKHLVGFEALARLPAPDGTLIPPTTFIPVAEELRLIDKVGAFVLRQACRTAMTWPETLTVAVNLSPSQFDSGAILDVVRNALRETGLAPHRLELEITETLLLRNSDDIMATLNALKAMGVSIVMDDFGTGYSSLSYLWKFPFDKIKIDRSFMESFEKSGRDVETVIKTIIALGREMNMRVTVEGVETPGQVDFLYGADADQVQGFYFGKPVPATEVAGDIINAFREEAGVGNKQDAAKERPAPASASS